MVPICFLGEKNGCNIGKQLVFNIFEFKCTSVAFLSITKLQFEVLTSTGRKLQSSISFDVFEIFSRSCSDFSKKLPNQVFFNWMVLAKSIFLLYWVTHFQIGCLSVGISKSHIHQFGHMVASIILDLEQWSIQHF